MIILSASEFKPAQIPDNCEYLNHVSIFNDQRDMFIEMLEAIGKVQTPYYFFAGDDDPIPLEVPVPTNGKGILYGDFFMLTGTKLIRRTIGQWDATKHLTNPFFIHKAVCRTDYTLLLASILPSDKMWFEFLYYYCLAYCFGAEYNPNFQSIWVRRVGGLHSRMPPLISNSGVWLNANRERVKTLLT